jgi:gallate decarboxylase subunit D
LSFEDIKLEAIPVGRDLLLLITGGVSHIGAASTAYPSGEGTEAVTSAVPGHKEHTLSEEYARRASAALGRTVTVVMGIHYDNLSKEEIKEISKRTTEMLDHYLLEQQGNGANPR